MKKFTLKDFILYNGPCFGCGSKIELSVAFTNRDDADHFLRPIVTAEYVELPLHIGYVDTLRLKIFHQTNKIEASDRKLLAEYLADRTLFATSKCLECGTWICSQPLRFEVGKDVLHPFSIRKEVLVMLDKGHRYLVTTSFETQTTQVYVDKITFNAHGYDVLPGSQLHFVLPLLPLYQIKTRQQLLSKLKTYVVFS